MKATDLFLLLVGLILAVIPVVVRLFFPTFGLSKKLAAHLRERGTERKFLIAYNIILLWIGFTCVLGAFLPEHLKLRCCIPLLIVGALGGLICNKKYAGTFLLFHYMSRK